MQTEAEKIAQHKYKAKKREERRLFCLEHGIPFRTHKWRERLEGETDEEFNRRYDREYHEKHKESRNKQNSDSYYRNWDKRRETATREYAANTEEILEKNKKWKDENPEWVEAYEEGYLPRRRELRKLRRAMDPNERIKDACRTRIGYILKKFGVPKFDHTFELIGCTPDFFKSFLEAQFSEGMSWDNYGDWEIDHVIPVSKFTLTDQQQRRNAFHYSNCKPLWKIENRMKNDRCPGAHQPLLV